MGSIARRAGVAAAILGLAMLLVAAAGLLLPATGGDTRGGDTGAGQDTPAGRSADVRAVTTSADSAASAAALQERLRRLPRDWTAWAALGASYVDQARRTADPTFYPRAGAALRRSLEVRPTGNAEALTGLATLAASRHDFRRARHQAQAALEIDPYDATALGVLTDALVELGRYGDALVSLQHMLDLKPGVPALARASYSFELRGDIAGARTALERALAVAAGPADVTFTLQYLGELAFNAGDLDTAEARFDDGLRRDPSYVPLLAGRARVLAARGEVDAALRVWQTVVTWLPQPSYLIEYGDLLSSLGRTAEAHEQYAVVSATERLFQSQGANVDLELALFEADHGRAGAAVRAARAEWNRRHSVHVEDAYAWALHAAGRDAEALQHAKAAARLGTRSALFAFHRGMIEKSLGLDDDARRSLERAMRINPYFSPVHAPVAERALAELGARS